MTYRERFGAYEIRVDGVVTEWFKSLEKAQKAFDEWLEALDEVEEAVELVEIRTGKVIARAETEEATAEATEEATVETVKDFIISKELPMAEERLEKLIAFGAPVAMIEGQKAIVADLKAGKIKIGGAVEKLNNPVTGYEVRKGNGGKPYILFADGTMYFPMARYGRYIK